jgi:hypothetical protein
MSEAIWYFADGDEERGPVTEAQIRALIGTGNLKADDLVWREGMDDWLPAREMPGLFNKTAAAPHETPAATAKPKQEKPGNSAELKENPRPAERQAMLRIATRRDAARPLEIFQHLGFLGQPLLLAGLLLVVGSRGCESAGQRYVHRSASRADLAESRFEAPWRQQRARLEQQLAELGGGTDPTPAERGRREMLQRSLQELEAQRQAERQRLQEGLWQELRDAAQETRAANTMWDFWRSGVFWSGTLLLALGLTVIGFTGQGPERWMCLGILAALLFSLYVSRPL